MARLSLSKPATTRAKRDSGVGRVGETPLRSFSTGSLPVSLPSPTIDLTKAVTETIIASADLPAGGKKQGTAPKGKGKPAAANKPKTKPKEQAQSEEVSRVCFPVDTTRIHLQPLCTSDRECSVPSHQSRLSTGKQRQDDRKEVWEELKNLGERVVKSNTQT